MGAKLRSLDLFTGIGGFTLALKGLADPVAYCDISEDSRCALGSLMKRRLLPRAPICEDITKLDMQWLQSIKVDPKKIDMPQTF